MEVDIKEYYESQVRFYEKEVKFESEQIAWLNKLMKEEKDFYGFETLYYKSLKNQRAKYYRERTADKLKIAKYTKLATI